MDQVLKARKLGSASARRKKMLEREKATKVDEERRMKILLYGYSSEEDQSSDEEGNTYSPIPDNQSDRTALSATSPAAVDALSKLQTAFPFPSIFTSKPYIPQFIIPPSLSHDADSYLTTKSFTEEDEDADMPCTEAETPIEIATPVMYSIPRARPSMISIRASSHRPTSMPPPPPVPPRSQKRVSTMSIRSAASAIEPSSILRPSALRTVSDNVVLSTTEITDRSRPVTMSVRSQMSISSPMSSPDIFPRRPSIPASTKFERPTAVRDSISYTSQTSISISRTYAVTGKRTSSITKALKPLESTPTISQPPPPPPPPPHPPADPSTKEQTPSSSSSRSLRKRRSSIGLALRSASSPFRAKTSNANARPPTSGSQGSIESKDAMDVSAFPMPPPSPLLQESFSHEPETPPMPSGRSRLRRVRTTIGL
jgi:hypothetical protein